MPRNASDGAGNGRQLLSERIRKTLADDIASGIIPQGAPLDEQQVADRFDTSRTPAREAIRQLAVEGLVEMRPRRGAVVATPSIERIAEMFELSAEIEAMCVRLATQRMNAIERANIQYLHDASSTMVEQDDFDGYDSFNLDFHEAIYRATHNGFLAEQALALRSRMLAFRRAQLREPGRPARSRHEHAQIVEAILRGDGEEAAMRMRAHMFSAAMALGRHVTQARKAADESA